MPDGPQIFGTDGIRGAAGEGWLSVDGLGRLGEAMGLLLREAPERFGATPAAAPRVVLARDTRPSGPGLLQAFGEGLLRQGCQVVDLSVAPTPTLAAAVGPLGAAAGAVLSASHNPAADNGIKLLTAAATKLPESLELELEGLLDGPPLPVHPEGSQGEWRRLSPAEVQAGYAAHLREQLTHLHGSVPDLQGLCLVVDAAQGAASHLAPALLEELGARVVALHCDGEGKAINEGCGALHPEGLARAVQEVGGDLGLALDGDADRVILVDRRGEIRDGDHVLLALGRLLHRRGQLPGETVVATVMSNLGLELALQEEGLRLLRTRVGDRHVAHTMREHGFRLGGEQAGHILVASRGPLIGDGLLTALHLLACGRSEVPGDWFEGMVSCPQALLAVPVRDRTPLEELGEVQECLAHVKAVLGDRGRVVLRYSGTELLARVMVEGAEDLPILECAESLALALTRAQAGADR